MTLRFEQILADGVAQTSYLVGDDAAGVAAVIDPRPDVGVYLETARRYGLAITHVFETHIHADFMSGARELVDRLQGRAKLCLSVEGGAEYGFDHDPLRDGDTFDFGSARLEAKHTPGHTPEHLAFLLYESGKDSPWGVLTGDSFFVDSVGRPDLMGDEQTEELTEALFHTVHDFYMRLDDGVIIYPCHGAGSECGPDIGDRMSSTIGFERRFNPYCRIERLEDFKTAMQENAPPVPMHYPHLKKVNAAGPPVLGNLPKVPGLTPAAFAQAVETPGAQLLDTRDMLAFGAGHIAGALNIGGRPDLSVWAGWLLDPERPIHLVLKSESDLPRILRLLWRTGFVNFGGYLAGGMDLWQEEGRPLAQIPQVPVHELKDAPAEVQRLDVRKQEEWDAGRIPGARHVFLGELPGRLDELDRQRTYATYCASGFRASAAASLLKAHGFEDVRNVPGSWKAWTAAGYPTSTD
ncbi:MBL fold metallo-hydrolase [Tranquillimonas alkanivorans]|uniref:Hydroxyacylglutathione hydrolase n=1 Tax=Tranquillimonas alkanivorans TaxID=441119 RepID=A0A1I5UDB4_9RHOB|nr:rhodanese-like domain-containing protein [Tranquillimonas alkanivorans]SFP93214.1 hydroxyacylglutathione hydrolase [Tranquillimonas alkanivorans]